MSDAPSASKELLDFVRKNQEILRTNQEKIVENQQAIRVNQGNIQQNQQILQDNQGRIKEAIDRIQGAHLRIECIRHEHFLVGCGVFSLSVLVVWIAELLAVSEHLPPLFHVVMASLFAVSLSVFVAFNVQWRVSERRLQEWENKVAQRKEQNEHANSGFTESGG